MNEGIQLPVLIIQSPAGPRRQERFSVPGVASASIRCLSVDHGGQRDHVCGSRTDDGRLNTADDPHRGTDGRLTWRRCSQMLRKIFPGAALEVSER